MSRKLKYELTSKTPSEFQVSFQDWKEMKDEVYNLRSQVQNSQGQQVYLHSKIVKLFSSLQENLDKISKKQKELELSVRNQWAQAKNYLKEHENLREQVVSNKVQNMIEKNKKINEKYSYQLQDLCQSLTQQSEQIWDLSDQVQTLKQELAQQDSSAGI